MGWKGHLRAQLAAEKRNQRLEQRRQRQLEVRLKEASRLSEQEQAQLAVDQFDNQIEVLRSVHKEQGDIHDWQQIKNTPPPAYPEQTDKYERAALKELEAMPEFGGPPERSNHHELIASANLNSYVPSFIDKLLGKAKRELSRLEGELCAAQEADLAEYSSAIDAYNRYQSQRGELQSLVIVGKQADEAAYREACEKYNTNLRDWEEDQGFADGVLSGDIKTFARVLTELGPFQELTELGSSLTFRVHSSKLVEVIAKVNCQNNIPGQVKTLTSTGKLSLKQMPKGRFHEIYQDYVCGCVLRIGREVFAILPVETVIVTVLADLFDSRTGHTTEKAILSVALPWPAFRKLNFNELDPSDAMDLFLHNGDFKASRKSGAFLPVLPLTPSDLNALPLTSPAGDRSFNPIANKWSEAIQQNRIDAGFLRITADDLAKLLGKPDQDNYTLPESKSLAEMVEDFGFCLEPDPRNGAGNFWRGREVGIFQPANGRVQPASANYLGASALLQLCLLVAAADGTVDRSELDRFRKFIENHFTFSPDEHQRLMVLESLLVRNASSAKVTLGRAAKRLPQDKHIVIGQFLVDVASSDGVISPKEYKALERIFDALDLAKVTLDTLIRNLALVDNEVVIQEAESPQKGESIPSTTGGQSGRLSLNMARVAAISAETQEVIGLLAKVMAEDETDEDVVTTPRRQESSKQLEPLTPSDSKTSSPESITNPAPVRIDCPHLTLLDKNLHPLLERLMTLDTCNRSDFDLLAREHKQMPLGAFDAINDWADQHLGDFLLEGEDPITIHRHLFKP